ncbi:hypothetical protein [Deinococcus sp. NW-56]|uniref:hypothetical protein n=1 Tax=Deinococcus sp. NW-56 TaxID=2080419 RepID=UPI00131A0376|nr:hypothetical protein [Deinococcus sp. NW-56]
MPQPDPNSATPLPEPYAEQSRALRVRYPHDPSQLRQPATSAQAAYDEAVQRQGHFAERLLTLGTRLNCPAFPRPGGVKSRARLEEKTRLFGFPPLDILAGKIVFTALADIYASAEQVSDTFTVVGFRDRFLEPRSSGYRDMQFIVDLGHHLAEVKLALAAFDELDSYEHRLYEMRRTLEVLPQLSAVQTVVLETLDDASTLMFSRVWNSLVTEGQVEE